MRYLVLTVLIVFFTFTGLYSQSAVTPPRSTGDLLSILEKYNGSSGKVNITMDPGIEDNYYKDLLYNQKNQGINGFRIRIFTGSGVNAYAEAQKVRAHFLSLYDNVGAYIQFDAPDYRVYVGDCRTRSEVLKLFYQIKPDFPNSFPVSHYIRLDKD